MTKNEFEFLLMAAKLYDFKVDVRDVRPSMIKGNIAMRYDTKADLESFVFEITDGKEGVSNETKAEN